MLSYEVFKEVVEENIRKYFDDAYEISFHAVDKINGKRDGIRIKYGDGSISPVYYTDTLYDEYLYSKNIDKTLTEFADTVIYEKNRFSDMDDIVRFAMEYNYDIVYTLVNTEANRELLETIPGRKLPGTDLTIIYRKILEISDYDIKSGIITNEMQKSIGMTEEELYQAALKDTERLLPSKVESLYEAMSRLMGEDLPADMQISAAGMYVITNERGIEGAAAIINKENLDEVVKKAGGDIYVIPSSIHECLAVPAEMVNADEIQKLVYEINADAVTPHERLSNNVYRYDSKERVLTNATFVSNKNLSQEIRKPKQEKKPKHLI